MCQPCNPVTIRTALPTNISNDRSAQLSALISVYYLSTRASLGNHMASFDRWTYFGHFFHRVEWSRRRSHEGGRTSRVEGFERWLCWYVESEELIRETSRTGVVVMCSWMVKAEWRQKQAIRPAAIVALVIEPRLTPLDGACSGLVLTLTDQLSMADSWDLCTLRIT